MGNRVNRLLPKLLWEHILFITLTDILLLCFPRWMLCSLFFPLIKFSLIQTHSELAAGEVLPSKYTQRRYLSDPRKSEWGLELEAFVSFKRDP